jgi:hypothetical protein
MNDSFHVTRSEQSVIIGVEANDAQNEPETGFVETELPMDGTK